MTQGRDSAKHSKKQMADWQQLTDDVALLQFPLRAFGIDFRRNVTLLRLRDSRVLIHSTAPFVSEDVKAIRRFGQPAWLVEATSLHDTFAKAGCAAFPELPYFAPADFANGGGVATEPRPAIPKEWAGEIEMLKIGGLRLVREYAFLHCTSRTLVLADLLIHFPPELRGSSHFFVQRIMRLPDLLGISLFFRLMIRDKKRFAESMRILLGWDFDRIVVAHSEPVLHDAKSVFARALRERGLAPSG